MSGHPYHYHCGCYACCLHEDALERAEADREADAPDGEPEPEPDPVAHKRAPASVCVVLGCLLGPALCLSWVHSGVWLAAWVLAVVLVLVWESIGDQ